MSDDKIVNLGDVRNKKRESDEDFEYELHYIDHLVIDGLDLSEIELKEIDDCIGDFCEYFANRFGYDMLNDRDDGATDFQKRFDVLIYLMLTMYNEYKCNERTAIFDNIVKMIGIEYGEQ
jgi:hypothetical protein